VPKERVHHGKLYNESKDVVVEAGQPTSKVRIPFDMDSSGTPEGYITRTEPSLDITWNRSGWVQVSIDFERAQWKRIVEEQDRYEAELGENAPMSQAIYTDVLTRAEINNMIKVLRKARDQAYGADE